MERTSFVYRFRRKCQALAHRVVSDELMSRIYYRIVMKKKLSLTPPHTFNEKLQWIKLYYFPCDEKVIQCADKYAV